MIDNIRRASELEAKKLLERAGQLVERRAAPTKAEPKRFIDWPVIPLAARVFVGGIQVPDAEDGFPDAAYLDSFLFEYAKTGVGIWALGSDVAEVFVGAPPFSNVRNWIKGNLVISPSILLSLDRDVVVIADEQLRFAVLGAPLDLITTLDDKFGGKAMFFEKLTRYIDSGDIGFGQEDKDWAFRCLLCWSCSE